MWHTSLWSPLIIRREAIAIAPDVPEDEKNKEIEKLLSQEKKLKSKHPEMLLLLLGRQFACDTDIVYENIHLTQLGPGESGKSTVVKQIKILTCNGFTPQEIEFYKHLCRKNIVEHLKNLLEIKELLGISLSATSQVRSGLIPCLLTHVAANCHSLVTVVWYRKRWWSKQVCITSWGSSWYQSVVGRSSSSRNYNGSCRWVPHRCICWIVCYNWYERVLICWQFL